MTRSTMLLAALAIGASLTACSAQVEPETGYFAATDSAPTPPNDPVIDIAATAPPAPLVEVVPAPIAGRVWVPGYWHWGGRGYVWLRGRYVVAPRGSVWIAPRYVYRGGRHYYYRPHWERRW
jgi:hypothetical protein